MWFNEPILLDEASCAHLPYCMLLRRIVVQNSKFQLVECIANVNSFEYGICSWLKKMRAQRKARISVCIVSEFPDVSRNGNINNAVAYSTTHQWFCLYTKILRERRDREKLVRFRLETADNTVRFILWVWHTQWKTKTYTTYVLNTIN